MSGGRRIAPAMIYGLIWLFGSCGESFSQEAGPERASDIGDPEDTAQHVSPPISPDSRPAIRDDGDGAFAPAVESRRSRESERLADLRESELAFHRGLSEQRHDNLAGSHKAYRRALELDPTFVEARVNLARVLIARGELADAARELTRAFEDASDYPPLYAARARLALARSHWSEARAELERALTLDPDLLEARGNLGALLLRLGDLRGARLQLDRALEQEPYRPEFLYNRALLEEKAGQWGEALYFYAMYLDLASPGDSNRGAVERRVKVLTGTAAVSPEAGENVPRGAPVPPLLK